MRAWLRAKARAKDLFDRLGGRRHRRWMVLGLTFVLVASLVAVFVRREVMIAGLRRQIAQLEARQVEAAAEEEALRAELASTKSDATLERVIRERLGLVRPNEEKAFFVEGPSP